MIEKNLEDVGKKLKDAISRGANGPLVAAADVVELSNNWQAFKDEAEGLSCSQWLRSICGKGRDLGWWKARADAVAKIGESSRRILDHETAVYLARNVPDDKLVTAYRQILSETEKNGGAPLTVTQARLRIRRLLGKRKSRRTCQECERLKRILEQNGIQY